MKNIIFLLSALVAPGQGSASEDGHETAEEREAATEQTTPGAAEVVPGPTEVLPGVELDVPGIEIQLPPAVSVQELELPEEKRKPVMPVAAGTEPGVFLEVPGIIVQAPELSEMTVKPQSRPLFVPKMVLYGPDEMKGKGKGFVILEKMEEEEEEEEEKVESPEESGKSEINGNSNNNFSEDLVIQALLVWNLYYFHIQIIANSNIFFKNTPYPYSYLHHVSRGNRLHFILTPLLSVQLTTAAGQN
jgi:hypothetical protein